MNVDILDCTLRDGGHVNEAKFGADNIKAIIDGLCSAGLDYVELGFLKNGHFTQDQSSYNDVSAIYPFLPKSCGHTKFAVMIRPDWYDINQLSECDGRIGIIRFAFYYRDIELLRTYIKKAKLRGYRYICNPVHIMGYSDDELRKLIYQINDLHPEQLTMVDTYGAMDIPDLHRIYSLVEQELDSDIRIGLHLHENRSLAYGLAQEFFRIKAPQRDAVIDASLLGIGRIPGNLCAEIIAEHMNRIYGRSYNTSLLYEMIGKYIEPIKQNIPWGYSPAYFITAQLNMHRSYAEFLLNGKNLDLHDIDVILHSIDPEMRSTFHADYIQKIYQKYKRGKID